MKHWVVLVISLFVIISAGIWEIKYFEDSARYVLSDIHYTENLIRNEHYDLAKKHIEAMDNTWDNMKGVWEIFVDHQEIDFVEKTFASYRTYVGLENKEEAIVKSNELIEAFNHIVEKQKLKIENVI